MVVKETIPWQPFAPLYVVTCYHEVTEGYLVASKAGFLSQPFPTASLLPIGPVQAKHTEAAVSLMP